MKKLTATAFQRLATAFWIDCQNQTSEIKRNIDFFKASDFLQDRTSDKVAGSYKKTQFSCMKSESNVACPLSPTASLQDDLRTPFL